MDTEKNAGAKKRIYEGIGRLNRSLSRAHERLVASNSGFFR